MVEVKFECFLGEQMHRDGVTRKSIYGKNVEALRRLPFEGKPGIADHQPEGRATSTSIGQVREILVRDPNHIRVDLVEGVLVAGFGVGSESTCSQANDPDSEHTVFRGRLDCDPNP